MRAYEFLKDDSELPDTGKDNWAGGGTEFEPNWHQEIGVDAGQGYQRASGNLPGGVNLSIAADTPGANATFMPQRGVNVSKGPANLYLGDRGAVSGSYNIPLDDKSSVSLSASGQKDQGLTGVGARYQRGNFSAGVDQPNFPGAKPQFNVGYSAQFEDAELDEMAGKINVGISQYLAKRGYQYLGGGIDKQAYLEPGGQVLIVFGYRPGNTENFSPDQRMFIDWIKYCNQNKSNPHLPRFTGFESFQFQGKNYIQARMERLNEVPARIKELVSYLDHAADHMGAKDFDAALKRLTFAGNYDEEADEFRYDTVEQIVDFLGGPERAANLLNTVHQVKQFSRQHGYSLDLHSGNYMQRANGTIVVNDPFVLWLNQ